MTWLSASWHKILIGLLTADRLWCRGLQLWDHCKPLEEFVERRMHERRQNTMNIEKWFEHLADFIIGAFQHTAPAVTEAVTQAAAGAAIATAEQDPKVQAVTAASVALLAAAQNLKAAINPPPPPAA